MWRTKSMSQDSSAVLDVQAREGETVIKITEDGFSPSEIKIKLGTKVRFVNESKYWHWPASDLHPTHTLYSEFDPKKPFGPGEEWSFTFDKAGDWYFHDHLSPYITGKVSVVE